MRFLIVILMTATIVNSNAQKNIIGSYRNLFGCEINLYKDSTYKFSHGACLESSWTKGKWQTNKDTIFFVPLLIYDTVREYNTDSTYIEKLILAKSETPRRLPDIRKKSLFKDGAIQIDSAIIGGQDYYKDYPIALIYKKDKLYLFYKRKLIKMTIFNHKRVAYWYSKM